MIIRIDRKSTEPLYLQIRAQVIAAIAQGALGPGDALPSVRSLAGDLDINLHTVNKAYAVLRDEGHVVMRGRSGAYIADPANHSDEHLRADRTRLEEALYALALEHRAHGGDKADYLTCARIQADRAYEGGE